MTAELGGDVIVVAELGSTVVATCPGPEESLHEIWMAVSNRAASE
jgi:hypothetical protein